VTLKNSVSFEKRLIHPTSAAFLSSPNVLGKDGLDVS
jgi:hypothetical protein